MKLSTCIERILVSGVYDINNEFMCNILDFDGLTEFKHHVQDMVASISPNSNRGTPLACALHYSGVININETRNEVVFEFTKQLYCWWVFDLKRKGL